MSIQFHLENEILRNLSYRHLFHGGTDYRQVDEDHPLFPVVQQHQQILDYLDGKPLSAIHDLRTPGAFIQDIDTFSGATVRGSKVSSAIVDGHNRELYTPAGDFSRTIGGYGDGSYRGTFGDRGVQQVSIQFDLQGDVLTNLSYRHLYHAGNDYLQMNENHPLYPVRQQHQKILEYLEGRHVSAIYALYSPDELVADIDSFTGATIRASKVLSAIMDGLNRRPYLPEGPFSREIGPYQDGRYRGTFGDRGVQQVSIQFHLENEILQNLSYRHLFHNGTDYRQLEEKHALHPVVQQHQRILEYLEGRHLSAIFDLYSPNDFLEDIDAFTGATVRGSKILSAIIDGLNRGLY